MQIFVKSLTEETLALPLEVASSLESVKYAISQRTGIPVSFQTLLSEGKLLAEGDLIEPGCFLHLNLSLEGGKKGKKKQYKTKKKNKHRHHKEQLTSLKYYNIEGNKVVRTHKICPECQKGIFMAKHWDRYYCGTCHLTLKLDAATIKANYEAMLKREKDKKAKASQEVVVDDKKAAAGKKGKKK